jgi:CheY-like chemotaxis protein
MYSSIPAYYFPSTVFLIDDDAALLSTLLLKLEKNSSYQTSTKPLEGLTLLQNTEPLQINSPECVDSLEEEETNRYLLNPDFSAHLKWLENDRRFREITVLIIDYTMPEINGIDLVAQLKDKPFKKILLTGEADETIAINAFNAGLIDRYLTKTVGMYPTLNTYIKELQQTYFIEQSHSLFNFVLPKNRITQEATFKKVFQTLIQKNNIVEYYLVNHQGAFLLSDAQGKMYYLDILSETDLNTYIDIAIGNEAPQHLIDSLRNHSAMPFFLNEADQQKPVKEWDLQPAQVIERNSGRVYYHLTPLSEGQYTQVSQMLTWASYQK